MAEAVPKVIADCRLVPVVEFEPTSYAARGYPSPNVSSHDDPVGWDAYWRASLADAGITELVPIRPGGWDADVDRLRRAETLRAIVRVHVERTGGPVGLTDPEFGTALSGGLALFDGDELLMEPQCCCDLENHTDWREAAGHRGADWAQLWTGHPGSAVRFDGARLLVADQSESADGMEAVWAVDPDALARAVGAAVVRLEEFAGRLAPVLAEWVGKADAAAAARRLAGLDVVGGG